MPEMSYLEAIVSAAYSARPGRPARSRAPATPRASACRIARVDEPPSPAFLDIRRRPACQRRYDRQSGGQRLHDRKAELLLATRAGIGAVRTDQPTHAVPDCREQLRDLAVGPVTQQDEGCCEIRLRRLCRPDPGQLDRFRRGRIVKIATDDDQGRPCPQRRIRGERLGEPGHPLQLVQPTDGQHDR